MTLLNLAKIEKDIPIPPVGGKKVKYPYKKMEVGDSFTVLAYSSGVVSSCKTWGNRQDPVVEFTSRRVNGHELRIWRIK